MSKPPLIASPTKRQAVIAVVMGLVLLAVLFLAGWLTGSSLF